MVSGIGKGASMVWGEKRRSQKTESLKRKMTDGSKRVRTRRLSSEIEVGIEYIRGRLFIRCEDPGCESGMEWND